MSPPPREQLERRILVLAPFGRDAELLASALRAMKCQIVSSVPEVVHELEQGAAAVLVAEEALNNEIAPLAEFIAGQPAWSDLPILVLTQRGADSPGALRALELFGNVTLLERPIRVAALLSTVRAALRGRERQYLTRAHMRERELADQRKDEFLATLAHELRNPLAPIRNSVSLLRLSDGAAPPPQLWEMMDRQVSHMVRLVDDLIEVSRITRGKIELRKARIDLSAVLAAAMEASRPVLEAANHQLTVEIAEPLSLDADAVRLTQVFSNLLNNAAKYTDQGGQIRIAARREGAEVVVSIVDNGIGMSAEALGKVFDMFVQEPLADGRTQAGLGIGLTIARNLVEMHGGTLTAHSEGQRKGSTLVVRLPFAGAAALQATVHAPPVPAPRPSVPRVLVVDDNVDAADSLGALLQMLGAEVRVVHDGEAALALIGSYRPAVVFLDIGMPSMDGYEVARRMRRLEEAANSKIIALTGWGQARDREHSRAAGFDHHLVKPADLATLQAVLTSMTR